MSAADPELAFSCLQHVKVLVERNPEVFVERLVEVLTTRIWKPDNYFYYGYIVGEFSPEVCPRYLEKDNFAIMKQRVERDQVRHGVQTYQEDAHDTGMVQLTVRPAYHGCTHYGATCSDQCSPAHDPPPTSNHHLSIHPDLRPNLYTPTSHTPSP